MGVKRYIRPKPDNEILLKKLEAQLPKTKKLKKELKDRPEQFN